MAPIKSSLARTVGKLLGVFNQPDLSLRGATQITRTSISADPEVTSKLSEVGYEKVCIV